MSGKIDWKQKYYELRSKYMNSMDVSFRLGFQEGQKAATMEQMQMQLQQAAAAAEAAAAGPEAGMEGAPEEMPEEMPQEGAEGMEEAQMQEQGQGDELDNSINELEQYVKSEDETLESLKKSLDLNTKTPELTPEQNAKVEKVQSIIDKWEE